MDVHFYLLIKLHNYFMLFLYMHHILQCHKLTNTVRVRDSKARVKEVINLLVVQVKKEVLQISPVMVTWT